MRRWQLIIALCTAILAVALPCAALAASPDDLSLIRADGPSAGTFIGAAMETMGYRAQSILLVTMWPIIRSLALLIWVGGAIYVVFRFALFKEWDGFLWLLLGPILFFFVTKTTTVATPVEWRPGLEKAVAAPAPIAGYDQSQVSWLFHTINGTISSLLRTVSGVMLNDSRRDELGRFMSRQRVLDDLLSTQMKEGGLIAFSLDSLSQCQQELDAARKLALGKRDPVYRATPEYKLAFTEYNGSWTKPVRRIPSNPAAREYLAELLRDGAMISPQMQQICGESLIPFVKRYRDTGSNALAFFDKPANCAELWCMMGVGAHHEVAKTLESAQARYGIDGPTWNEMLKDITEKLTTPEQFLDLDGQPLRNVEPAAPDPAVIPTIISGYLIRKALQKDFQSGIITQLNEHAGLTRFQENFNLRQDREQMMKTLNHGMIHQIAENKRYELFSTMMNLPYIQGVLLYGFALLFPFFSLLLLVPGKAQGFMAWVALWAWVKSWDVGWAVIAILDQVLWEFMPRSSMWDYVADPNHSPISVFDAAFQGDPSHSLATYYSVMALLLGAVPLLTSQAILGGASKIGSKFVNGASDLGTRIGNFVQAGVTNRQLVDTDALREMHYVRKAREGFNVDQTPESKALRSMAKDMKTVGNQLLANPNVNIPLAVLIPGGAANAYLTGQQAGIAMLREANRTEAALTTINGNFALFKATDTIEGYNLDKLRSGLSERGEFWNQTSPNYSGYQAYRTQALSMATSIARINEFYGLRERLMKFGIK